MPVLSPFANSLTRRLGDELIVVNLADDQVYTLSGTAARCWELLANGTAPDEIPQRLCEEFDVGAGTARRSVAEFISQLRSAGLLADDSL